MHIRRSAFLRSYELVLCCMLLLSAAISAQAQEAAGNLVVEETTGAVKIKFDNRWQSPDAGMTITLPATVSTGADGSIKLRQDATIISVASNTAIDLFQGPEPGSILQRVVQNRGSAFYDIAPRGPNKLRVETPYLVAVIKGTQFNVTVAAEASTVSLFEGRLQIEAPDVGDIVDLREGHIARRHKDDTGITVLRMEDSEPVSRGEGSRDSSSNGGDGHDVAGTLDDVDSIAPGDHGGSAVAGSDVLLHLDDTGNGIDFAPGELAAGLDSGIASGELALDIGIDTGMDPGAVDAGLDTGLDLGEAGVAASLDLGADLGNGAIDAGLGAGVDLGDAGVDAALDLGADLGAGAIDAGLDVAADLGGAAADVGLDAGADLGAGDIDAGLDVGADLGGSGLVDAGVDTGADLGSGEVDLGADAGADLGVVDADIGVDADLDLGDLDDLVDVDLELELGLLGGDDSGTDDEEEDNPPIDPGDLLDLLRL